MEAEEDAAAAMEHSPDAHGRTISREAIYQ